MKDIAATASSSSMILNLMNNCNNWDNYTLCVVIPF